MLTQLKALPWKWMLLSGLIALILGGVIAYLNYPVSLPPQTQQTDADLQALPEALLESIRRVESISDKVRKEVTSIRATAKKEITVLPPDGVADGLNDELASFRSVEVRTGRLDNP